MSMTFTSLVGMTCLKRAPRYQPFGSLSHLSTSHYFSLFLLLPPLFFRIETQFFPFCRADQPPPLKPDSRASQNKDSLLPKRNYGEKNFLCLITHTRVGIFLKFGQLQIANKQLQNPFRMNLPIDSATAPLDRVPRWLELPRIFPPPGNSGFQSHSLTSSTILPPSQTDRPVL